MSAVSHSFGPSPCTWFGPPGFSPNKDHSAALELTCGQDRGRQYVGPWRLWAHLQPWERGRCRLKEQSQPSSRRHHLFRCSRCRLP